MLVVPKRQMGKSMQGNQENNIITMIKEMLVSFDSRVCVCKAIN